MKTNHPKCRSILVAEDNEDIRETLAEVLSLEGYEVQAVSNGQEALQYLKKASPPVLVLLDLMMPVMSGWEFLDAQKRNPKLERNPVVVLSAVPATQSLEDLEPLGTAGAISKPINLSRLLEMVGNYCLRSEEARTA